MWLSPSPLVLASRSVVRRAVLESAGIPVEVVPADVDERTIESNAGVTNPTAAASLLARSKALAVAPLRPGRLVLGADQTLALGARRFSKPTDRDGARRQLQMLRGQTHVLHSAITVARDGAVLYDHVEPARLTMRAFSNDVLDRYLDKAGDMVTASVGSYQLERIGIHLFERIDGDHFTILGMPILPLLAFFREAGVVA